MYRIFSLHKQVKKNIFFNKNKIRIVTFCMSAILTSPVSFQCVMANFQTTAQKNKKISSGVKENKKNGEENKEENCKKVQIYGNQFLQDIKKIFEIKQETEQKSKLLELVSKSVDANPVIRRSIKLAKNKGLNLASGKNLKNLKLKLKEVYYNGIVDFLTKNAKIYIKAAEPKIQDNPLLKSHNKKKGMYIWNLLVKVVNSDTGKEMVLQLRTRCGKEKNSCQILDVSAGEGGNLSYNTFAEKDLLAAISEFLKNNI